MVHAPHMKLLSRYAVLNVTLNRTALYIEYAFRCLDFKKIFNWIDGVSISGLNGLKKPKHCICYNL